MVTKLPKKVKKIEDHLKAIQYLLAGILLRKETNLKQVAKIIGISDKELTKIYPQRKEKKGKIIENER
jgi:DNA-binding Xre family transcriptional regulator